MEVADDGVGGADPDRGSGLRGLADRVSALDGTLELRLRGGPTVAFGTPEDAERKAVTIRWVLEWAGSEGTPLRTLSVVSALAPAATLADPA